jgi:hypothetical protein
MRYRIVFGVFKVCCVFFVTHCRYVMSCTPVSAKSA